MDQITKIKFILNPYYLLIVTINDIQTYMYPKSIYTQGFQDLTIYYSYSSQLYYGLGLTLGRPFDYGHTLLTLDQPLNGFADLQMTFNLNNFTC